MSDDLNAQERAGVEIATIRERAANSSKIVFVSGNFNIVHPGHLRLLNFAAGCGDFLVVGVHADGFQNALLPEALRLENVRSIGLVDHAFTLNGSPEDFIGLLQPPVVVKGKEYELRHNPEANVVAAFNGELLFSSGDVRFSSLDLLQKELVEADYSNITKPSEFTQRHNFSINDLIGIVNDFARLRIVVVGDLIVDEYVTCDPLGMSQEDPCIVVTPIKHDRFVGGASIVAAHARGLGAHVNYFGIVGNDAAATFAEEMLRKYDVESHLLRDDSRPTTLKQRFRAHGKTLLRVSHLRQHDIGQQLTEKLFGQMERALDSADLLIFSDFSYGCLPQPLVDKISGFCSKRDIMMVADSQASSQVGDVSRFKGMRLLTPTEREARLAVRDFNSSMVVLAEELRRKADAERVLITLGAEGLLIHTHSKSDNKLITDRLPAFNSTPKDVAGAGDSLLTCTSMALAVNADIWKSAYLGTLAAACQVSRVGNRPLTAEGLITELSI